MSQPEISPLARRLAEENNVDWRGLHGSGAGGKVVERDVLEFLARVMAGEEDVDPTPEPVPEGMEGWPEEDVRSFQQEVQASRRDAGLDEIQQELSAADRSGNGAYDADAALRSAHEGAPVPDADEISEDIFLFGDDGTGDAGGPEGPRAAAPDQPLAEEPTTASGTDDALLVAGEDGAADAAREGAATADGQIDDDARLDVAEPGEVAFGGEAGDGSEAEGLPDVFGGADDALEEPRPDADAALFEPEGGRTEAGEALEMPSLGEVDAAPAAREGGGPYLPEKAPAAEGGLDAEESRERPLEDADAWEVETGPVAQEGAADAPPEEAAEPGLGAWPPEPYAREPEVEPAPSEQAAPFAASADAQDALDGAPAEEDAAPQTGAGAVDEPLLSDTVTGAEAPSVPRDLPLVTYGTLLRRHVDVTALAGAQLAIGLELGESEPLSPAPFLVRAAAKAVAEGQWGDASVAMVALEGDGGVTLRTVENAVERPFLELVRALAADDAAAREAPAALSVVDMSALDVDEAVLDVGGPSLTLGRILYDNQRGSYRSTLSLAGDVPAERGSRLLARVAELLDAPIRLLL